MNRAKSIVWWAAAALAFFDGAFALVRSKTPLQFLVEAGRFGFACGAALAVCYFAIARFGRAASGRPLLAAAVLASLGGGALLRFAFLDGDVGGFAAFACALFGVTVLMLPLAFVWSVRVSPPMSAARRR